MARVVGSTGTQSEPVVFELDRFERTGEDRVAVSGRWFGVRGRRFVRPTLTMRTDRGRCRSLADLAHKPWAAEEGQQWQAEFSLESDTDGVFDAELAVAPDIEIPLPALGGEPRSIAAPGHLVVGEWQRRALQRSRRASALDGARHELAQAREEIERLSGELEDAKVETAAALARRDAVLEELAVVAAERDEAAAARVAAVAARDAAVRERDEAVAGRRAALAARDEAVAARDALAESTARLQSEKAVLSSARGAALAMHNARNASGASRRDLAWAARGLAIVVLIAVAAALAVLTHLL